MRIFLMSTLTLGLASAIPLGSGADATPVTLDASADIYNASGPIVYPGESPFYVDVTGIASFTFSVPTGSVASLNSGRNLNDADGVGSEGADSFNTGGNGISGLTAPNDGFLTGVFLGKTPTSVQPAALNFLTTGTSFTSLSPLLQQSFFIGDGLTGDGTGTTQTFYVPAGATALYLGISDACSYHGPPSCYSDNSGSFSLDVAKNLAVGPPSAVPEPMTWAMMIGGLGMTGGVLRRKRRASVRKFEFV